MEDVSKTSGADGASSSSSCVPAAVTILDDKLEIVTDAGARPSDSIQVLKYRIEKVPQLFRNNEENKGDYDPKLVSLGPYHHGKSELQLVEKLKPMVARLFLSNCGKDMDELKQEVRLMVDDLRSCYVEGSTEKYCDEKFAEMMLLDGCFILSIITPVSGFLQVIASVGRYSAAVFMGDIFILENQLPFQVLKLLMCSKFNGDEGMKKIDAFLDSRVYKDIKPEPNEATRECDLRPQPLHLLELFRIKLVSRSEVKSQGDTRKSKFEDKHRMEEIIYSFRSVTELKAKGIHVCPGSTPFLEDIKFKSSYFYGRLELPPFSLSEIGKLVKLNMIAYELCPNSHSDSAMVAYINFMKLLINHPDDVKELRSNRVLFSILGSDEEVVKMFKNIITYSTDDFSIYDEVKERIQEHCNSKAKTWMAEFIHNYFSGPWTLIAFLAAASGLALTFIQAYFAIFPRPGK